MSTLRGPAAHGPSSKWSASCDDGRATRLARVAEDASAEASVAYRGDKPPNLLSLAPARATDRQARDRAARPRGCALTHREPWCRAPRQAACQLLSAVLGGGAVLGLPFCFRSCGAVLGSLLLAACGAASLASAHLLLAASSVTGARSYEALAALTLGARGGHLVAACVWTLQLGSLVASLNVLADLTSAFAGSVVPPGAEPSRTGVIGAVVALALLPLALAVRSPRSAAALSATAPAFVLAFVAALLSHAAGVHARGAARPLALWRAQGAPVALPVMVFALSGHAFLFPTYASLRAPTPRRMASVAARALGAAALLYAAVGLFGYAAFRERTAGDVLRNLGGGSLGGRHGSASGGGDAPTHASGIASAAWRALKVAYGASVVAAVPLAMLPLREALSRASAPSACAGVCGSGGGGGGGAAAAAASPARRFLRHGASVVALLAAALACALAVPNLEFVFALTGATACVLLSYILPAAIYLRVAAGASSAPAAAVLAASAAGAGDAAPVWLPAPRAAKAGARALLLAGLLAGAVCTRATLSAVAEEADTVQLARAFVATEKVAAARTQRITQAAAAVASADAVQDAAAALFAARAEAADALGRMRSAHAATAFSSSESDASAGGGGVSGGGAAGAEAMGAALEGAAAALAAANSKVDARLAGVVSAAEALTEAAVAAGARNTPPAEPPVADAGDAHARLTAARPAGAGTAVAAARVAADAAAVSPLPSPPPWPADDAIGIALLLPRMRAAPSALLPPGASVEAATPPASRGVESAALRAHANATVAALAHTSVALDAVQRAANNAAGASTRGAGATARAQAVDDALGAAGVALSAADASLSALQAAAGSHAADAERALVNVLLDAAAPEEAAAAAAAVLHAAAGGDAVDAKPHGASPPPPLPLPHIQLPLPLPRLRFGGGEATLLPPVPPPLRLNASAAAAAAVQAVARSSVMRLGITVRAETQMCTHCVLCDTQRLMQLRALPSCAARGGGEQRRGGDARRGDCAPPGRRRRAGCCGGGGHAGERCGGGGGSAAGRRGRRGGDRARCAPHGRGARARRQRGGECRGAPRVTHLAKQAHKTCTNIHTHILPCLFVHALFASGLNPCTLLTWLRPKKGNGRRPKRAHPIPCLFARAGLRAVALRRRCPRVGAAARAARGGRPGAGVAAKR
jgi:hypothetical protein